MLHDYFSEAHIHCIDINEKSVDRLSGFSPRVFAEICSQGDRQQLQAYADRMSDFDLIIDDGSHNPRHQLLSLEIMLPKLKPGGLYICEDIHTSCGRTTTQSVIHYLHHFLEMRSEFISPAGHAYVQQQIESIDFYKRDQQPLKCYQCNNEVTTETNACVHCGIEFLPNETDSMTCVIAKKSN